MICFESVKFEKMQNISEELVSFDLKENEINSLVCSNKNITNDISKTLTGTKKESEGYVFIEGYDIFSKRTREMYSIIDDNLAFLDGSNLDYKMKVSDFINQWLALYNIKDKLIINKLANELHLEEFKNKQLREILIAEYCELVIFFMKITNKKHFIIKDFFSYLGDESEADTFIKKMKDQLKKTQQTLFLINFNFFKTGICWGLLEKTNYSHCWEDA